MSTPMLRALVVGGVMAFFAAGCALTSKSDPIVPRYYSPERPGDLPKASPPSTAPSPELRLGHVEGSSHLGEMIVFRDSTYELGQYRERRWTEAPEEYLKRRLARVLFEERGLRRLVGGAGPTLEVELTAFEEIRGPKRTARVQVIARLHDQRLVRWEETLTVDQPVRARKQGDPVDPAVEAIGEALRAVVDRIADRVARELAAPKP